ncbi:hypothetical protein R1sor_011202 [Riccia sorocarpa]|uniref:Tyrosinase copper-binding domain-containing protein n=1 Tax=Riccia sorocarpa TaxID=122646 RepID=A0ABD3I1K4_9MARC
MAITATVLQLRFNTLLQFIAYVVLFRSLLQLRTSEVQAAPVKITLNTLTNCTNGTTFSPTDGELPISCCPEPDVNLNVSVVDFVPKGNGRLRVRKALQCLSGEELTNYTEKLTKGYELLRNLPADDPRSLMQQRRIHCAYCTGSFTHDGLSSADNFTIDIHFNWLFLPWHRIFLYFHERILQTLLGDENFTLHFWNFDNGDDATNSTQGAGCFTPGHFVPEIYNDNSTSTFDPDRANRTLLPDIPVDLSIPGTVLLVNITVRSVEEAVPRNRAAMQYAMATGTVPRDYFGIPLKYGDVRPINTDAGSMEVQPHSSMHRWLGAAMVLANTSAGDPIFYTFHANFDRLWHSWMGIGNNSDLQPTDPDWLDAEFLFWDENKILTRVKVSDVLSIDDLGYSYEKVNDAFWISWPIANFSSLFLAFRCSCVCLVILCDASSSLGEGSDLPCPTITIWPMLPHSHRKVQSSSGSNIRNAINCRKRQAEAVLGRRLKSPT